MRALLLLQLLSTLFLLGLIWFVQIVHYPLHALVGQAEFPRYEAEHANRTGYVAAPLMIVELLTSAALLRPLWRPASIPAAQAWLGAALVAALWLCTFLIQVPLHDRLHHGHNHQAIARLVQTNWIRTILWSARAALVLRWAYIT